MAWRVLFPFNHYPNRILTLGLAAERFKTLNDLVANFHGHSLQILLNPCHSMGPHGLEDMAIVHRRGINSRKRKQPFSTIFTVNYNDLVILLILFPPNSYACCF
jgi:hypothetical protein